MAEKANQRENRASTPAAPQTLNVYGAPKTSAPKPAPKPAAKPAAPKTSIPAPRTDAEISKVADELLKTLGTASTTAANLGKTAQDLLKEEQDRLARVAAGAAGQGKDEEEVDKDTRDAFALLKDTFDAYGLNTLATEIEKFMKSGLTTSEAKIELRKTKAYEDRFYGNKLRSASNLNVLSEAEYLDLENSYSETLKSYGLQDYFGTAVTPEQKVTRQKAIAAVIGNDISAVEFKDRVKTSVDRVANADAQTKAAFKSFYNITDTELVKYFLDPAKSLVSLKEKAAAAEIGGAASLQGLSTTAANAEELAKLGITKEQAQAGYQKVAEVLPTAQKLSAIYDEDKITYGQTEAEAETFKGLASAKRKREQLVSKEIGTFSGQSGLAKGALSRGSRGAI
jgi:hypothetical protein